MELISRELYNEIKFLSQTMSDEVQSIIIESEDEKPEYGEYKGWVVVAFKNAVLELTQKMKKETPWLTKALSKSVLL